MTRRFAVIGTAHVADPELLRALEAVLDAARPDQLILEIPDDAAAGGDLAAQKPEMAFACQWARRHAVPVSGHEPPGPPILRDGLSLARITELVEAMDRLIAGLTTRRTIDVFCGRGALETPAEQELAAVIDALVDPEKALSRTDAIIAAVEQLAVPQGGILILCGGAHVARLAAALPDCRIIRGAHFF